MSKAQVTSVNYLIDYNEVTDLYDCKIVIGAGSAMTYPQRIQFNAQYSVVVPTGSTITIEELHNPLENNQFYTGTIPCIWDFAPAEISPPVQPEDDFHRFFPSLVPTSSYNNLMAGDTVTLFSLAVDGVGSCQNVVRLFENGVDPSSQEMPTGADFSNGFTLGGINQIYSGNLPSSTAGDWSVSLENQEICQGACIELTPEIECNPGGLTYLWSTGESTLTILVCPTEETEYTVDIMGPNSSMNSVSSTVSVAAAPAVVLNGPGTICPGATTMVTPTTGGSWTSDDPGIATVFNNGVVTGTAVGTCQLTFTDNITGCTSEEIEITVLSQPVATITGSDSICVQGTTTLTPSTGGTWTSSNPLVGNVDNSGNVTALSTGTVVFTFTDLATGCTSMPSDTLWILADPVVAFIGDDRLCKCETSTVSPNSGGTWVSNVPSVASIDAYTGVIKGLAQGATTFTFTDTVTGCSATTTGLIVDPIPTAIADSDTICISTTANLSPSAGGTWQALSPTIASLNGGNIVQGNSSGDAGFLFTSDATGCTSDTIWIHVDPGPSTLLTGPDIICLGETTTIEPSIGGSWASLDPTIGTVDNFGNITGVGAGITQFIFTDAATLCTSEPSVPVQVIPSPIVSGSTTSLCINEVMNLTPGIGGSWISSDPSVATVNAFTGEVTAVSDGMVSFTFTEANSGCTATTEKVTVHETPFVEFTAPSTICAGFTTAIAPTSGGVWTSSNVVVATIDNLGNITGISPGMADLVYTDTNTGCSSKPLIVTVIAAPEVSITGEDELCIGETTTLAPTTGGTWSSDNAAVATVDNSGNVTPVGTGFVRFTFAANQFGCTATTEEIIVHQTPNTFINGPSEICIGQTTQLEPSEGGMWSSSDATIATISNDGLVQASSAGIVTFTWINSATGCASNASDPVLVHPYSEATITDTEICLGEFTQLSPSTGGTWSSNNPATASVDNAGFVTSISEGLVTFTFTSSLSGCPSLPTAPLLIKKCTGSETSCSEIGPDQIFCDYEELSDFGGNLLDELSQGVQPEGDLCEGGDEVYNAQWIGFYALEGNYEIVINKNNCLIPNAGILPGIQVGLYSSCEFNEANQIFCEVSEYMDAEIRISSDMLVAGTIYYMYIDGLNKSVCDFEIEVEGDYDSTPCNELSKVTGLAFIDKNENGIFDVGETPLRNILISLSPGNFSVLTNDEGKYTIDAPKGGATLTALANEGEWKNDFLVIEDVSVFEDCVEGVDFGFIPSMNTDISATLSVANTITRCDWETRFTITVENTGSNPFDGLIEFEFDEEANFFSSPIPNLNVNGNTAFFEIGELQPFTPQKYQITLKMPSGSANLPVLDFSAELKMLNEDQIAEYSYSEQLRCSYDPNDKRTFPDRPGEDNLTLMDEDIEYTIRFQNNGNDTAFNVRIVDELDFDVDARSVRVVNSSHDVETCIEGNLLIFMFADINLVDSTTSYELSQGFVTFRCNSKTGRTELTPVINTADIIFDTNEPIVTNTTLNTLVSELCTDEVNELDVEICDGDDYEGYNESGTYTTNYTTLFGCDSTVIINLEVQGITYSSQDIQLCEGQSVDINGTIYSPSESVEVVDTIRNDIGCITNVMTFDFDVIPIIFLDIDTTICEGMEYEGLDESGIYTIDSFDPMTGCDIITTIDLEVLPLNDPNCMPVSTEEAEITDILVYPNPARDVIFIESGSDLETITIYTSEFQLIKNVPLESGLYRVQIGTDEMNRGMYFLAIKAAGKIQYKKIIIE
ncbi:MAG: T9SS type A sorting domain-containing protein [Bacteroidota bacterium]